LITRRGTSIIEVMIVMIIVGVMTAIAAPRLRPSAKGSVDQNARLLAQDLDHARVRAFGGREIVRVVVRDTMWRAYMDHNRDSVITESATEQTAFGVMHTRYLGEHVRFGRGVAPAIPTDTATSLPVGTRRVEFAANGTSMPFGTSTILYLTYDSDSTAVNAVEVNPAANVRVWRWIDGAWQ
jgi:prepilin-type N-terminal cleavage/methylation domain-containing protein